MGIVEAAKQAERQIRNNRELLEKQMETLKIVYEHNAISRAEYDRSMKVLRDRLFKIA